MERINRSKVAAVRGETTENILEFEELFGCKFGDPVRVQQWLGQRSTEATNAGVVCIHFRTGGLTEVDVGFYHGGDSPLAQFLGGDRAMIVSDHPWANLGDPGNIAAGLSNPQIPEGKYGPITGQRVGSLFVSGDGKDPRKTATELVLGNDGGSIGLVSQTKPPRPDGGLRPNTSYWVTLRRVDRDHGDLPPLGIVYKGSDDPASGGEQEIGYVSPDDIGGAKPMIFDGVKGLFVPIG